MVHSRARRVSGTGGRAVPPDGSSLACFLPRVSKKQIGSPTRARLPPPVAPAVRYSFPSFPPSTLGPSSLYSTLRPSSLLSARL
eukprot:5880811-Pyramimonas_sp.AAC.1